MSRRACLQASLVARKFVGCLVLFRIWLGFGSGCLLCSWILVPRLCFGLCPVHLRPGSSTRFFVSSSSRTDTHGASGCFCLKFMTALGANYKVVRDIVFSDGLIIERSKQLRRLEVGEIIEVYEGPTVDPSVGVHRVRGCALRDGAVGWVTIAGNPGLPFLSPGGNVFKVLSSQYFSCNFIFMFTICAVQPKPSPDDCQGKPVCAGALVLVV